MTPSSILFVCLIGLLLILFVKDSLSKNKEEKIKLNEQIQKLSIQRNLRREFVEAITQNKNPSFISQIIENYTEDTDNLVVLLYDDLELDYKNLSYTKSFEKAKLVIDLSDFIEHLNKGTIDTSQFHFKLSLKNGF